MTPSGQLCIQWRTVLTVPTQWIREVTTPPAMNNNRMVRDSEKKASNNFPLVLKDRTVEIWRVVCGIEGIVLKLMPLTMLNGILYNTCM